MILTIIGVAALIGALALSGVLVYAAGLLIFSPRTRRAYYQETLELYRTKYLERAQHNNEAHTHRRRNRHPRPDH